MSDWNYLIGVLRLRLFFWLTQKTYIHIYTTRSDFTKTLLLALQRAASDFLALIIKRVSKLVHCFDFLSLIFLWNVQALYGSFVTEMIVCHRLYQPVVPVCETLQIKTTSRDGFRVKPIAGVIPRKQGVYCNIALLPRTFVQISLTVSCFCVSACIPARHSRCRFAYVDISWKAVGYLSFANF